MAIAILILLSCLIFINILSSIVLVRFRESYEREVGQLKTQVKKLSGELLVRLPPRPYGVELHEPSPSLTVGPVDSRIQG
jgi:hypothetical protein